MSAMFISFPSTPCLSPTPLIGPPLPLKFMKVMATAYKVWEVSENPLLPNSSKALGFLLDSMWLSGGHYYLVLPNSYF